jgi:hypothetical protein
LLNHKLFLIRGASRFRRDVKRQRIFVEETNFEIMIYSEACRWLEWFNYIAGVFYVNDYLWLEQAETKLLLSKIKRGK